MKQLGLESSCKKSNGRVWKLIAGVALGFIAVEVLMNLRDIKRYIHISMM